MSRARHLGLQRGVSLVEAIVAMAVMAFGMMAIVGLQASLRSNSDLAKQRSEAVRIAEDAIEKWRAFSQIGSEAGRNAYDDITLGAHADKVVGGTNASFTLKQTVSAGEGWKSLQAEVVWADRAGVAQSVTLNSVIAGADPAGSGTLSVVPGGVPVRQPLGRSAAIPPTAVDLGDNKSAYRPPGAPHDTVWVFDNLEGVVTSVCTFPGDDLSMLVPADNCFEEPSPSWLISGVVRFSFGPNPSGAAPTDLQIDLRMFALAVGAPFADGECFVAPMQDPRLDYTDYVCRVPQSVDTTWTGRVLLGPPVPVDPPPDPPIPKLDLALHDVCRYSNGNPGNINHPRVYTGLDRSLGNQNFLVVDQGVPCPAGTRRLQPPEALPPPPPPP